ncbi:DUF3237 domain-containing protein [Aurantivibrio plasticivorans]
MFKSCSVLVKTLFLLLSTVGFTMNSSADTWQKPDVKIPTTELVLDLKVLIGAPVRVGPSDAGMRQFIPITGGEFEGQHLDGAKISGEVIPGGADWQLVRPDGVLEVKAIYAIKTADGAVIEVDNRGLVASVAADEEKNMPASRYVRTTPTFKAPKGQYEWLNQRVFTGTITPSPKGDFVQIRVFLIH